MEPKVPQSKRPSVLSASSVGEDALTVEDRVVFRHREDEQANGKICEVQGPGCGMPDVLHHVARCVLEGDHRPQGESGEVEAVGDGVGMCRDGQGGGRIDRADPFDCLLYTSDAADE